MSTLPEAATPELLDAQRLARAHLRALAIPAHRQGYEQLVLCIELYSRDPNLSITKELYPAAAKNSDWTAVEHAIRNMIYAAWQVRDADVWKTYFPKCTDRPPTNKQFIATIAELIR